jgi:hypothetical protein
VGTCPPRWLSSSRASGWIRVCSQRGTQLGTEEWRKTEQVIHFEVKLTIVLLKSISFFTDKFVRKIALLM